MGHGGCGRRAVPMFFAGREPDDVAGTNFFDGTAFALGPTEAGGDDDGLAEGMRVPGGAGAGFEGDNCGGGASGRLRLEERIDPDCAGEPIGWAFGGGL